MSAIDTLQLNDSSPKEGVLLGVVVIRQGRQVTGKIAEVGKERVTLWEKVRWDRQGHPHGYGRKVEVFNPGECRVMAGETKSKGRPR